jgi:DNA adenine methylase
MASKSSGKRRIAHRQSFTLIHPTAGKRDGRRLYTHSQLDHEALFHLTRSLTGDFLLTYDDTEEVRDLARQCHLETEIVAMKSTHHAAMNELLIGRNLDWARASCQNATLSFPLVSTPASA